MIRVTPAPEPAQFDLKVRQPGLRAIAEMVGTPDLPKRRGRKRQRIAESLEAIPAKRFPPYWQHALPDLLDAYGRVCAYTSFYIERVTGGVLRSTTCCPNRSDGKKSMNGPIIDWPVHG